MTPSEKPHSHPVHDPKLVIALDYEDQRSCLQLVERLDPKYCRLKVGKEMFTHFGPAIVETLQQKGFEVFLDLKFHDIPNTVAKAVKAAANLGVWMVNVHASGGLRMMEAAKDALGNFEAPPLLIAVTVLTSMSDEDLAATGHADSAVQTAERLAKLAAQAGMDGVVSSAQEAAVIKSACGDNFITVTPGIRPAGAVIGDQRRVLTPLAAIQGGSDYLVIGRPITQARDPLAALQSIVEEIAPEVKS